MVDIGVIEDAIRMEDEKRELQRALERIRNGEMKEYQGMSERELEMRISNIEEFVFLL